MLATFVEQTPALPLSRTLARGHTGRAFGLAIKAWKTEGKRLGLDRRFDG
jgi:hypothetical protein